jgi:pSer/pThr/pTyr-binding forkhead associated (FHA) protein
MVNLGSSYCNTCHMDVGLARKVPSLLVIAGPLEGEQIDVDRTLVVGRHDVDVVIDDPELSRRHLEIRPDGDGLIIEDLSSTNGTFVDRQPIESPTRVAHGDRFTLGATVLEVQVVAQAGATRLAATTVDPDATHLRSAPSEPIQAPAQSDALAAAASAPPSSVAVQPQAAPVGVAAGPEQLPQQFGVFKPPAVRRGSGLASRSWVPVALSFGTAILTAIALVIYFAQR